MGPTQLPLWLSGIHIGFHTRDPGSRPGRDRNTESDMDPEALSTKDLLAVIGSHEASFQRHEEVLRRQEEVMTKHSELLADVTSSIRQLFQSLPGVSSPASPAAPPLSTNSPPIAPVAAAEPRLPPPKPFSGDPSSCQGFLTQCSLTFELQPSSFPTDRSKIAYIITLLTDKALSWASAAWESQPSYCQSYTAFEKEFKKVFNHPVSGQEASKRLLTLRQGPRSAADFAIEFRTIAAGSGWNDEALRVCFLGGLAESIQDEMATREPAKDLESLIDMAIRLDIRLRERRMTRGRASHSQTPVHKPASPVHAPPVRLPPVNEQAPEPPEDMQLGRSRLSPSERDRRMRERRCLYCGMSGHFRSTCPELSGNEGPHRVTGGL